MKLPKIETLIIFVFVGCVALWAMSKCSAKRSDLVRQVREIGSDDRDDRPVRNDTIVVQQPAQQPAQQPIQPSPLSTQHPSVIPPVQQAPLTTPPPSNPTRPTLSNQPSTGAQSPSTSKYSTLYVAIDGLKVRKEPGLKSESIVQLELYESVTFLNKKTEWTQEISLGYEKVTDHWVKVRTQSGKEGWVFGAGVHYYKMKRQGVLEEDSQTAKPKKN